jgi:flagellar motor switch protein FliM
LAIDPEEICMPDILSQDEIDALLTATGSPEPGGGGGGGPREVKSAASMKPVVTYDFKHPNRVSKDQIRTLENIHSSLAKKT